LRKDGTEQVEIGTEKVETFYLLLNLFSQLYLIRPQGICSSYKGEKYPC